MPCFLVQRGYVLVDILHLLVRETPGRLYVPLVQKATVGARLVEELHFLDLFCDDWAWLSLNRRSRQLLVTCGYERSVFFLVYDRGNRVDVRKAS
jgi:hypothetical protein